VSATTIALLVAGLVLLAFGAEMLVRGGSRIAAAAGISPMAVGLTVVAYGTSTPELTVGTLAAWQGRADIAVGNVVGSNIFNVLFILGLSAAITPLAIRAEILKREVPIMIGASLLLWALAADGRIGAAEGLALVAAIVGYTVAALRWGRRERPDVVAEYAAAEPPPARGPRAWASSIALVLLGLGALVLGGHWLVDAAVAIARAAGLSETVVGLTVVAAGTSLPELATSLVATIRGERDIAVGNVVGSNIYNILAILGASALVAGGGGLAVAPAMVRFDIPVMVAVAVACLPIVFTGRRIARWEGFLLLGYYVAYTAYLVLAAQAHDAAPVLGRGMLLFAVPLTIVTLAVGVARSLRRGAPPLVRPGVAR
jgi:cation:H+ antiporter